MFKITAPFRIDLGGGVTDIPEISALSGTSIVNLGLDLFTDQKCTQSANIGFTFEESQERGLRFVYNGVTESLVTSENDPLHYIKLCLRTHFPEGGWIIKLDSILPSSTGLGGSSIFATCVLAARFYISEGTLTPEKILPLSKHYESEKMGIKGGFQDFIGSYFGGLNYITFPSLIEDHLQKYQQNLGLPLRQDLVEYLNHNMIVVLLKHPRLSSDLIVGDEIRNVINQSSKHLPQLKLIVEANAQIFQLLKSDFDLSFVLKKLGCWMIKSWAAQKNLSYYISGKKLIQIERELAPFCYGIRGPGAGGNSLFMLCKPNQRSEVLNLLSRYEDIVLTLPANVNNKGVEILS